MKARTLTLLLLAALAFGACHSSRRTAVAPLPDTTDATQPLPPHRTYTVVPFTAEVDGMAVSGQLRMAEDSVMWLSVNKFIEVARALATADSLFLHAPMLGYDGAMDYPTLQRHTGVKTSLREMQQMALAPDAEQRIAELAAKLGFNAKVQIGQRRQVQQLNFPYAKPQQPVKGTTR